MAAAAIHAISSAAKLSAVLNAAQGRFRPVGLAASIMILALVPLLTDSLGNATSVLDSTDIPELSNALLVGLQVAQQPPLHLTGDPSPARLEAERPVL